MMTGGTGWNSLSAAIASSLGAFRGLAEYILIPLCALMLIYSLVCIGMASDAGAVYEMKRRAYRALTGLLLALAMDMLLKTFLSMT